VDRRVTLAGAWLKSAVSYEHEATGKDGL